MKWKQTLSALLILALLTALLTGCGGAQSNSVSKGYAMAPAAEEFAYDTMAEAPAAAPAEGAALTSDASGSTSTPPENRKWIVTIHMSAETEDLDAITAALDSHIASLGGYVEHQNVYNGSAYSSRRYRSSSMTIRIPAEKVDQFTQEVAGIANVISQEKNRQDVTLSYVATESRVTALETEQERLLELLSQAETMTDLLEIEARLTDVRYELERYASQLRVYDNQIDYATIHLDISEVQEYTPVEEPTLWERIREGFSGSLEGLGESLQDLLVLLIVCAPFLLVYGSAALVIILLIRRLSRRKKAPKEEKAPRQRKLPWRKSPSDEQPPTE